VRAPTVDDVKTTLSVCASAQEASHSEFRLLLDQCSVPIDRQAPAPAQQYGTARRAFEAHLSLWSPKVEALPTTRAPRIADVGPLVQPVIPA